jgi:flagellar biosynthesis chaperone FliJ
MDELKALLEIRGIRKRRVEEAEDALRKAQAQLERRRLELKQAEQALADYLNELPSLIKRLYEDVIGFEITQNFLQEKVRRERELRARVEDFKARVKEATDAVEKAKKYVDECAEKLKKEQLKLDALDELIQNIKNNRKLAKARADAKVLDELANARFVRARA